MKFTIKLFDKPNIATLWEKVNVTLSLCKEYLQEAGHFSELKPDKYYSVEIKPISDKKTKSQNDYAWELITALSQEKRPYISPIEIYRNMVQDFKTFYVITVPLRDEQNFINSWSCRGRAWMCDVLDRSEKFVAIKCTYGMSQWSKEQISEFIDLLKDECRQQGIPTERIIDGLDSVRPRNNE